MAYELLNNTPVTPSRLHAMVRLVSRLQAPTRKELYDLLQPLALISKQSSAADVYTAAVNCGLIDEIACKIVLKGDAEKLESAQDFQAHMQQIVWGVTEPYRPNYRFNLYSAWYVVQNERVFQFEDKDYETHFLTEVPQDTEADRSFNMQKFVGWRMWAAFLGLGWPIKPGLSGQREILAPDASKRLRGVLPQLLSQDEQTIPFRLFAERLARVCPELDGGSLFTSCWEASRGSEQRGNKLSLAVSTGLRQLHSINEIQLIRRADATDIWQFYEAEGQLLKQVTHIRLGEK